MITYVCVRPGAFDTFRAPEEAAEALEDECHHRRLVLLVRLRLEELKEDAHHVDHREHERAERHRPEVEAADVVQHPDRRDRHLVVAEARVLVPRRVVVDKVVVDHTAADRRDRDRVDEVVGPDEADEDVPRLPHGHVVRAPPVEEARRVELTGTSVSTSKASERTRARAHQAVGRLQPVDRRWYVSSSEVQMKTIRRRSRTGGTGGRR